MLLKEVLLFNNHLIIVMVQKYLYIVKLVKQKQF